MSSALKDRSAELLYLRSTEDPVALPELSDVVLLNDVLDDEGTLVPAGTRGTVVAALGRGEACIVEFAHPLQALATLNATMLARV